MACTSDAAGVGNSPETGCARSPAGTVEMGASLYSFFTKIDGICGIGKKTLVRSRPFSPQVGLETGGPGALEAEFAPSQGQRRGTWGAGGRIRPKSRPEKGYLVHQSPNPPQVLNGRPWRRSAEASMASSKHHSAHGTEQIISTLSKRLAIFAGPHNTRE